MKYSTEQEAFWKGSFGDEYAERNRGAGWVAANTAFFSNVLARSEKPAEVLELGSNIGLNLIALRHLLPEAKLSAVEINEKAARELKARLPDANVYVSSILEFRADRTWDLVFTKERDAPPSIM